jgi:hypothetical protein
MTATADTFRQVDIKSLSYAQKRTINVQVPDVIYWKVRESAVKSKCSMKEYVTRLCLHAKPLDELPAPPAISD